MKIDGLGALENATNEAVMLFKEYAQINKKINPEILSVVSEQRNPSYITNILASHLVTQLSVKQELLEENNILKKAQQLIKILDAEISQVNTDQML